MVGSAAAAVLALVIVVVTTSSDESDPDPTDSGEQTSESLRWRSETFATTNGLAVEGETACGTTAEGIVYCVDVETGDQRFRQGFGTLVTAPAVADGLLLVGSDVGMSGWTFDGDRPWRTLPEVSAFGDVPPPIVDDAVLVVEEIGADSELVAFDVTTGDERWRLFSDHDDDQPRLTQSSPFSDGTRIFVGLRTPDGGYIVALDPATGSELWRSLISPGQQATGGFEHVDAAAPLADSSAIAFVVARQDAPDHLVVLESTTGQRRWDVALAGIQSGLAHLDGTTFVADGGILRAYDAAGIEVWEVPEPDNSVSGEPLEGELKVEGGQLYDIAYDVHTIDPQTGASELVAESISAIDVAVVGDRLLIAGTFDLRSIPRP